MENICSVARKRGILVGQEGVSLEIQTTDCGSRHIQSPTDYDQLGIRSIDKERPTGRRSQKSRRRRFLTRGTP